MMYEKVIRSPFFYVGDKYRLMPQLRSLFPRYISTYIEPFAGGGSSFLNTPAERYLVNDIDLSGVLNDFKQMNDASILVLTNWIINGNRRLMLLFSK